MQKILTTNSENFVSLDTQGFSLIELILYIALLAIFISGVVVFAWNGIYASTKSSVERDVNQNIRFSIRRIAYEVRNSSAINVVTPTELCLASAQTLRNPTRIYLEDNQLRIAWGGGTTDCTNMTNDQSLTSNTVEVSNLQFVDTSSGESTLNIAYSLLVSATGSRQEWQHTQLYEGASEVRSN